MRPEGLESIVLVVDTHERLVSTTKRRIKRDHPYVRFVTAKGYIRFFERAAIPRFASIALHDPIHKDAVDILSEHAFAAKVQDQLEPFNLELHEFDATVTYPARIDATPAELTAHPKRWYERSLEPKINTAYAMIEQEARSPSWIGAPHARRTTHR